MPTPTYLDLNALTTYDEKIKQYVDAQSGGSGVSIFYGTCATAAATAAKVVVCEEFTSSDLVKGVVINVRFTNAQTYNGAPTLNVQSTGAKNIKRVGTTNAARYEWLAGEVLQFVYDGSYWMLTNGGVASTTYYGVTRLSTGATSTATGYALTPASLNNFAQAMVSGAPVYSSSETYAIGDRVRYSNYTYECTTAITTAEAWNSAHWTALDPLQEQVDAKQDALVSGTNIKTVNGTSLLGSGDIDTSELPTVTSSDNGKVLQVSNGAWAAASAPSGGSTWTDITDDFVAANNGSAIDVTNCLFLTDGTFVYAAGTVDTTIYNFIVCPVEYCPYHSAYVYTFAGCAYDAVNFTPTTCVADGVSIALDFGDTDSGAVSFSVTYPIDQS